MAKLEGIINIFSIFLITLPEILCANFSITSCSCGSRNYLEGRIVGGEKAEAQEFPWHVVLYTKKDKQYCGGSIINNMYILTAAHCFKNSVDGKNIYYTHARDILIFGGSNDFPKMLKDYTEGKKQYVRQPLYVILHQFFDPFTYNNDIALIKLFETFTEYSYEILPICLPPIGPLFEDEDSIVSGFGAERNFGPLVGDSRKTSVQVFRNKKCQKMWHQRFQKDLMICAASRGRDACDGDSGGALVKRINSSRYIQIGIVSFGKRCGVYIYPGVYTRVNRYVTWIMENTKDATYCQN
ncbi:UNVERIFIED_CONTAM: hypothetical protein RMT77_003291 [Armadillidium vulgare]